MLDATFHRVALQTMMSSLAYSRGTAYLLEAKSATCHVDIKLGQNLRPGHQAGPRCRYHASDSAHLHKIPKSRRVI